MVLLVAVGIGSSAVPVSAQTARDPGTWALEPLEVLRTLSFEESGGLLGPASQDFWTRVFEEDRVPDDPGRELRGLDTLPRADAAFVLAVTCAAPPRVGRARLHALAFVQRVFPSGGGTALPAILVAARAVMRYPMLMLSVERMGITDARVYASLAHAARRFELIPDPLRLRQVLSQFQGAVALVERARLAGVMPLDAAGPALLALAAVPMTRDRGFDGAVSGWLTDHLLPGLGVTVAPSFRSISMDEQTLAALAGVASGDLPVIDWEGLTFRYDRRAAQYERYSQTRSRLGGNRLDAVLALSALATDLTAGVGEIGDIQPLVERLEASTARIQGPRVGLYVPTMRAAAYEDQIRPLMEDLRGITNRRRLGRLPRIAERLRAVVDVLLADLLRTLPYVLHLASGYGIELLGNDVAARHEFGVRINDRTERARAPWMLPRGRTTPPTPFLRIGDVWLAPEGETDEFTGTWHVYGALMSLDLALSTLYLPRFSNTIPPTVPLFTDSEEEYFAQGVTLFNPSAVTATQVTGIAEAIRWGRARVRRLGVDAADLAAVGHEAGLSPARRAELAWTLQRRPDALERLFSRSELLWLGLRRAPDGTGRPPAGWGAPALWPTGCLCVRVPAPDAAEPAGTRAERLASRFADLQLALAEAVDELALPAPIVGDLLPLATRELLDGVQQLSGVASAEGGGAVTVQSRRGRFDALVRYVQELPRERIEDYVAALVGPGRPLNPVAGARAAGGR